jgi:protein TonB
MQIETLPRLPARSNSRLASIALVAGLHVIAIYALLTALNPNLIPVRPDHTAITIFHSISRPLPLPLPIPFSTKLVQPSEPVLHPPKLEITNSGNPPLTPMPNGGAATGSPPAPSTFEPLLPILVTHTIPEYPAVATRLGEQGSVRLSIKVDANGMVTEASVLTSSGHDVLDSAAIAWVKAHWKYKPARRNGIPIAVTAQAIVTFRLSTVPD